MANQYLEEKKNTKQNINNVQFQPFTTARNKNHISCRTHFTQHANKKANSKFVHLHLFQHF